MIAKMQPARQHSSSFKRLQKYLTTERDPETGGLILRGDVLMSSNFVDLRTVADEMEGVASLNPRCNDAVCHYELSWPPGRTSDPATMGRLSVTHIEGTRISRPSILDRCARRQEALPHPHHGEQSSSWDTQSAHALSELVHSGCRRTLPRSEIWLGTYAWSDTMG